MKVVQINTTFGKGSTGKICLGIAERSKENGIDNIVVYSGAGIEAPLGIKYSEESYKKVQALKSRIFGNYGFNSTIATKTLIKKLDELSPDIVHIHNIHGHDCNLDMLFDYFKKKHIKIV
jgi:hypothetical protein